MKNVLFVAFDDLFNVVRFRDVFGPPIQTPNIDRLLSMGTYFDGAHAVVPLCNPSRVATLTGQSPFRTGVEQNEQKFHEHVDPSTTLPYLFKEAGYTTATVGKIFHGHIAGQAELKTPQAAFFRKMFDVLHPTEGRIPATRDMPEWEAADFKTAAWGAKFIRAGQDDEPWFLSVGFMKPHLDWNVPDRYYRLYDRSKIVLPENPRRDFNDIPLFFQQFFEDQPHFKIRKTETWDDRIVGYMAAITFADAQLGTLLRAMDRADAWDDTTLALWSDHGYHLGDKKHWGKFTHWEQGTNAPLIIVDPDVGRPGTVVRTPVSLLDLFPTLVDLAGIDDPIRRDGHSLVPLLRHPNADWDHFAGSIFQGSISLRAERYRYIASIDGSEQLYDMVRDPDQFRNLAERASHEGVLDRLRDRMSAEVERLGGKIDLDARRLIGSGGDQEIFVSPNLEVAAGRDGDDVYFAIRTWAIEETRSGGFDTLKLFAPREGKEVDVRVPRFVEQTVLYENASGHVRGSRRDDAIWGAGHNDRLDGGRGEDRLLGAHGNDLLRGGPGSDRLLGGAGRDRLEGGPADDVLRGGRWQDLLVGGAGRDRLSGGGDADIFKFKPRSGVDEIVDFQPGKDRIDLTALDLRGFGAIQRDTTEQGWAVARIPDADVAIVFHEVKWSDLGADSFLI